MPASIRPAQPEDVERIAALHVTAWLETYRGLVAESVIASRDLATRRAQWGARLDAPPPDSALFVAEEPDGAIVAFGACGRQRDPALPYAGEFHALYVLRRAQRAGIGRGLMRTMATALLGCGLGAASLWVLRGNLAARAFYTELGGVQVAARETPEMGAEVAFGWSDLRLLTTPRGRAMVDGPGRAS
jgi:GNAT superfamily N-acetyltransferase